MNEGRASRKTSLGQAGQITAVDRLGVWPPQRKIPRHTLRIKVFADGADLKGMLALAEDPLISGFTTNPTLMRRSGVTDYTTFAKEVLAVVTELPISFEVVADEFDRCGARRS